MSEAVLLTIASVFAGVIVVLVVPFMWNRIGGLVGFALGVVAIPAIWLGSVLFALRVAGPIATGEVIDPKLMPHEGTLVNTGIFAAFALVAIVVSLIARRGRK
jgi:hypothetical protein